MTDGVRRLSRSAFPASSPAASRRSTSSSAPSSPRCRTGAVSYLYYADRIYELPLAIVGIAIGVVLLPDVARQLRADNTQP